MSTISLLTRPSAALSPPCNLIAASMQVQLQRATTSIDVAHCRDWTQPEVFTAPPKRVSPSVRASRPRRTFPCFR